ncbi:Ppx/GppA family phosphatase [Pendulispora rubella]|uniref:Ppx/GppA family phosphatase n=1 Tax=Pendulispora rubella TaxID=2741070 RepID=A0ABZ2L179_9BACT
MTEGRIATIDIGTNTVLLLVAERTGNGSLRAVEEHATITRLGQGVDKSRTLHPDAIARTCACLDVYGAIVKRLGVTHVAVVGTSAMRDARGSEVIAEHIGKTFGVELRVIGGDEEAELTFAGALVGLTEAVPGRDLVVFDIGGGSTEVVRGTLDDAGAVRSIGYKKSFDVGSVRLTERHVRSDPPSAGELDAIRADLDATFSSLGRDLGVTGAHAMVPIGIAGTVTTLAAVAMTMETYDATRVHGHHLTTRVLRSVVEHLASLPLALRREVPGLEPKRADVIVAGGLVVLALLEHLAAESLVISDRGVRWGLAVALSRSAATL